MLVPPKFRNEHHLGRVSKGQHVHMRDYWHDVAGDDSEFLQAQQLINYRSLGVGKEVHGTGVQGRRTGCAVTCAAQAVPCSGQRSCLSSQS